MLGIFITRNGEPSTLDSWRSAGGREGRPQNLLLSVTPLRHPGPPSFSRSEDHTKQRFLNLSLS